MKYCPDCGSLLETRPVDGLQRKACISPACHFIHWDNPVPVVAALVQLNDKIVLARNAQWPAGVFSMITGYLEKGETPEQAVIREVREEIGLDCKIAEYLGCYSLLRKNQIILAHSVIASGVLKMSEEIVEVRQLSRDELHSWSFGALTLTDQIVKNWLNTSTC